MNIPLHNNSNTLSDYWNCCESHNNRKKNRRKRVNYLILRENVNEQCCNDNAYRLNYIPNYMNHCSLDVDVVYEYKIFLNYRDYVHVN